MSDLDRLFAGDLKLVIVRSDGTTTTTPDTREVVVLAGSFNPLHRGHRRLLESAKKLSGRSGLFEISIENVDKPDLPRSELENRLEQFKDFADVAITRAKLFADKAALIPGAWFVLGYDTAVRLLDDRYYENGDAASHLKRLGGAGTKFLVAGRQSADGSFHGLESIEVPADLKEMFIAVPEETFREDISSTELRRRR